jgi:hypothetical protein
VTVLNVGARAPAVTFSAYSNATPAINAVVVLGGDVIVTAGDDGTVCAWTLRGDAVQTLAAHKGPKPVGDLGVMGLHPRPPGHPKTVGKTPQGPEQRIHRIGPLNAHCGQSRGPQSIHPDHPGAARPPQG